MEFCIGKAIVIFHLSLLCFSVVYGEETLAVAPVPSHHHHHHHVHAHHYPTAAPTPAPTPAHHHHHVHPPAPAPAPVHHQHHHAPAYPPVSHSHPPVHPPSQAPAPSPKYPFQRALVAVQGVVFCKASCKYAGVDTLWDASPLPAATVKLQCNNTRKPQESKATTDKNGYFFLKANNTLTTYGAHKCKVSLVSSPNATCTVPSVLHGGSTGAPLKPSTPFLAGNLHFLMYSVGPFAFEPKCPH